MSLISNWARLLCKTLNCWRIAGAVLSLTLGVWLATHALGLYHQAQGERLLIQAVLAENRLKTIIVFERRIPPLISSPQARTLAEAAGQQFRAAASANPANALAYRWRGRTALLLGDLEGAAEAFSEFIRLRPRDPLGYWELGLVYDEMANRLRDATDWAVGPRTDPTASPFEALASPKWTVATLEAAEVQTPDVPIDTPYCAQGHMPRSCFVASTEWEMPNASEGLPSKWWGSQEPVRRGVLFTHSPARVSFQVALPVTPTAIVFWMGIDPAAWAWMGDGVEYRVAVDGEYVFRQTFPPDAAWEGWRPGQVDLSRWAGRRIRLTLETDAGPAGDGTGDWAGWGETRLVEADKGPWSMADPANQALAAWRAGRITAQQLIETGEEARKAGQYEEALEWYERAARVEPGLGDPWYYTGLAYEGMERWEKALAAYERALTVSPKADIYFRAGKIAWLTEDYGTAEKHLRSAIALAPESAGSHYWLSLTLNRQQRYAAAINESLLALELDSTSSAAFGYWFHLGNIYAGLGMWSEAERAYSGALNLQPESHQVQEALEYVISRK